MALCLLLAGCSSALSVTPPPQPAADVAAVCAALQHELPTTVAGQSQRETTPASELTAAWGDPPIVLRCGVSAPAGLTPTSEVTNVNGVDWYPEPLTAGYRFTTTGRRAYVQVDVPSQYASQAGGLTQIGPAILAADPPAPGR